MMDYILSVVGEPHASDALAILGYVAVPLFIALVGAAYAVAKVVLRCVQFMVRSEATQRSIADSNMEIRDKLAEFTEKTNDHLGEHDREIAEHDREIAVLKYARDSTVSGNGRLVETNPPKRHPSAVKKSLRNQDLDQE